MKSWKQNPYDETGPYKRTQRLELSFSNLWGYGRKAAICKPGRGPSPNHSGTLTLDFQPPELWEINICCLITSLVFFYSCCYCHMLSCFSHVWLFATLWTVASLAPLCGILQERRLEWVAMPFSSVPVSLMSPALADGFLTTGSFPGRHLGSP